MTFIHGLVIEEVKGCGIDINHIYIFEASYLGKFDCDVRFSKGYIA